MYQEQVPSYMHLDEPLDMLDEGRFVFECILAGISKPLLHVDSALKFKRLYCAFVWLSIFPGNSVSCYKINCSLLVNLTERLHSWYCTKLDQPKSN